MPHAQVSADAMNHARPAVEPMIYSQSKLPESGQQGKPASVFERLVEERRGGTRDMVGGRKNLRGRYWVMMVREMLTC